MCENLWQSLWNRRFGGSQWMGTSPCNQWGLGMSWKSEAVRNCNLIPRSWCLLRCGPCWMLSTKLLEILGRSWKSILRRTIDQIIRSTSKLPTLAVPHRIQFIISSPGRKSKRPVLVSWYVIMSWSLCTTPCLVLNWMDTIHPASATSMVFWWFQARRLSCSTGTLGNVNIAPTAKINGAKQSVTELYAQTQEGHN